MIPKAALNQHIAVLGKTGSGKTYESMPDAQPLPTGEELQRFWFARLPEGERKILEMLIDACPHSVDRESMTRETGYKRSTRDAYLQRLKAKELVIIERDGVRASGTLFQGAA